MLGKNAGKDCSHRSHPAHDHSKYCYSDNGWILIGDMNRMTSQFHKGGGGIVVRLFNDIIFINDKK